MKVKLVIVFLSLYLSSSLLATESTPRILGMSVTGNKESPRSLIIVPWRSPLLNGDTSEIKSVWQPKLKLLDPVSYRRNINLYLKQRAQ